MTLKQFIPMESTGNSFVCLPEDIQLIRSRILEINEETQEILSEIVDFKIVTNMKYDEKGNIIYDILKENFTDNRNDAYDFFESYIAA